MREQHSVEILLRVAVAALERLEKAYPEYWNNSLTGILLVIKHQQEIAKTRFDNEEN